MQTRQRLPLVAALAACIVLAGCATTPPEEDPVFIRLNDLDRRLERLERILSNQSLLELAQQVQGLDAELRSLRGSLEQIEHAGEQLRTQQRDLYGDLDRRLEELKNSALPPASAPPSPDSLPIPGGSDRANYQAAFDMLKEGRYEEAMTGFHQFLGVFPDSDLADNAQYWLGEAHYARLDYAAALQAFQDLVGGYSRSDKLADGWLKIGFSHYELKNWPAARQALETVLREYPDSSAATEARRRLERMTAEGR
jgi:tol-pal system protein YbgF